LNVNVASRSVLFLDLELLISKEELKIDPCVDVPERRMAKIGLLVIAQQDPLCSSPSGSLSSSTFCPHTKADDVRLHQP
jgi:hypothetical protein